MGHTVSSSNTGHAYYFYYFLVYFWGDYTILLLLDKLNTLIYSFNFSVYKLISIDLLLGNFSTLIYFVDFPN